MRSDELLTSMRIVQADSFIHQAGEGVGSLE